MMGYYELSLKENSFQFPPLKTLSEEMKEPEDTAFMKKVWYLNLIGLLAFSIEYTQVKNYPFHGIWGVLAWAIAVITTYPVVLLLKSGILREFIVHKENMLYIYVVIMSWGTLIYWLHIGMTLG
jgi:hypothetical protein